MRTASPTRPTALAVGQIFANRKLANHGRQPHRHVRGGAGGFLVSILVRVAALAAVFARSPLAAALALIAGEAVSRAALVRMWHDLPAARTSGLANDTGPPDYNAMLVALVVAAVVVLVTALPALALARNRHQLRCCRSPPRTARIRMTANALGGRTGDALGACQQVALVAFLAGASAI